MSWFAKKLRSELPRWVEVGLISDAQRDAIERRYPDDGDGRRVVALFSMIGAAVIATGVMLLIGAHWDGIHDWVKIVGMLAVLVAVHAIGYRLRIDPGRMPRVGDAVLMLASVLFLAGIALVSQVFNLNDRPPTGVLIWWLGIAATPLLTRSVGAQSVSSAAGIIWLVMELAYRGSWLELTGHGMHALAPWSAAVVCIGLALLGIGLVLHRSKYPEFAGIHEGLGMLGIMGGLYAGGFTRHEVGMAGWEGARPVATAVLLILAAVPMVGAWTSSRELVRLLAPWLGLALLPVVASLAGWHLGDGGEVVSLGYWLSLLVLNLAVVYAAVRLGRPAWVNLSLAFIAVNVFTRYWDLFGTMLDGGLFFIVSGLVILGLGIAFEKSRRKLASEMKGGGGA